MRKLLNWFVDPIKQTTVFIYFFLVLMTIKGMLHLAYAKPLGIGLWELILILLCIGSSIWMLLTPSLVLSFARFMESGDDVYRKSLLKLLRLSFGYFLTKILLFAYGDSAIMSTVLFLIGA